MSPSPPVGFLPAAGRGMRFGSSRYIKELFPLLFTAESEGRILEPRPLCELALRSIRGAGAERCVVMVSPDKWDVLRVLGHGEGLSLSLAYLVQPEPRGLPDAVRCARPWIGDSDVLFAMPDTIVLPADSMRQVWQKRVSTGADLVLGVFPADEPERLGPVEMAPDGSVLRILDKPGHREQMTTWGVACWSAAFTDFCIEWGAARERSGAGEPAIGHAFEAARQAGMKVEACAFQGGVYLDIGTPHGLRDALRAVAEHGFLEDVQAALGLSRP